MKTETKDYYTLLGITQDADLATIKKAYRHLARKHHPDKNPGDPHAAERFRDITEAYELLTDPARRQAYDATCQPAPGSTVTPPRVDVYVLSRVLGVLENIWQVIQARHPEVPAVVIIIASGTEGRQPHRWGHYDPDSWVAGSQSRPEIMISGEGLKRDARSVLGTLLHEATHALAAARGIQDTSRQGRYHNKRFKTLAGELGITTEFDQRTGWLAAARGIQDTSRQGRYHNKRFKTLAGELGITTEFDQRTGWSPTTVPDHTAAAYELQLQAPADAMTLWRLDVSFTTTTRRNTNLTAATCPCGRRIRAAASTLAEAPIICGDCVGYFEPVSDS